jgi:hypothetical protein
MFENVVQCSELSKKSAFRPAHDGDEVVVHEIGTGDTKHMFAMPPANSAKRLELGREGCGEWAVCRR